MVTPFPRPGRRLEQAYRELRIAEEGTKEQKQALGKLSQLPRPWDPDSLTHAPLRRELWDWLEDVVTWLNLEYVWDVAAIVPACWPHHPHLVRELAVLADQRRQASRDISSDALEEWHRYALPAFHERMRSRIKSHCEESHQPWPAQGRHTRHTGPAAQQERQSLFDRDIAMLGSRGTEREAETAVPLLHVIDGLRVDTVTGEVLE